MRGPIWALAACLILVAVVAGCGGGGDEGKTTTGAGEGSTTAAGTEGGQKGSQSERERQGSSSRDGTEPRSAAKAEFVAKANSFCEKQRQQLQSKLQQITQAAKGSQKAALTRFSKEAVGAAMKAEAEELRALGPPEGDEEEVEAIIASIEAIATEARENPATLASNASLFAKARKLAQAYGVDACGAVL